MVHRNANFIQHFIPSGLLIRVLVPSLLQQNIYFSCASLISSLYFPGLNAVETLPKTQSGCACKYLIYWYIWHHRSVITLLTSAFRRVFFSDMNLQRGRARLFCYMVWNNRTIQSLDQLLFLRLALFVFPTIQGNEPVQIWQAFDKAAAFSLPAAWGALSTPLFISLSLKPVLTADMQFSRNFLCNFVLRLESPEEKYIGKITSHTADFALCLCDYISCASLICNDK